MIVILNLSVSATFFNHLSFQNPMAIHVLSQDLINKIAAGEVIERPAAVVKELIENSMDAKATSINVEIREGGKSFIKIEDNGTGMPREDALLSVERHSTSKINEADDLFNIRTLGFRGEALASIGAVSNLRIITKTKDDAIGTYIEVESSKVKSIKELACNTGTIIEVRDLFFNVPARKKYLKTIMHEHNIILDLITRYALANKEVSFKLVHDNKIIFSSNKSKKLIDTIINVYGTEIGKTL